MTKAYTRVAEAPVRTEDVTIIPERFLMTLVNQSHLYSQEATTVLIFSHINLSAVAFHILEDVTP